MSRRSAEVRVSQDLSETSFTAWRDPDKSGSGPRVLSGQSFQMGQSVQLLLRNSAFGELLPDGDFDQGMIALTAVKATTRVVSLAMLISSFN